MNVNRIYSLFLGIAVSAAFMMACSYNDKTTYAGTPTPDIIIDTTGIPATHVISRDDTLVIRPSVSREGTPHSLFEFEWRLTLDPGTDFKKAKVIGKEECLNYVVTEFPDASYYSLWYRVTDKTTGLMESVIWQVQVEASSGQGLVVAYTQDGKSTDFGIVQDSLFTGSYFEKGTENIKPTSYRLGVYSRQNGKTFDGVVRWMFAQPRYLKGRETYMLHGASKNNVFRINTIDYSVLLEGKDCFYDPFVEIDVDFYMLMGYDAVLSNQGRLYGLPTEAFFDTELKKFGIDLPGDYHANSMVSDYSYFAWFEEDKGIFYVADSYIRTYSTQPEQFVQALDDAGQPIGFDLENMKGYRTLAAGQGKNEHCFILEKEGKVGLFTLNKTYSPPFHARRHLDISDAPGIQNAVSFAFSSTQDIIYYVTDNVVWAIVFSGTKPVYKEVYTPGESVGFIAMLKKTGKKAVPFNEKCLLVVTDGSDSKIYALKLAGINTGEIEDDVPVFEGFGGKITAVAVQD